MKKLIFVKSGHFPSSISPGHIHHRGCHKQIFVIALIAFSFTSCFKRYYSTNTVNKVDLESFKSLDSPKRYYILHSPKGPFTIANLKINENGITGNLDSLPPAYERYLNPKIDKANDMVHSQKRIVLSQVHIYTNDSSQAGNQLNLPFSQITRLDAYGIDKAATRESTIISTVGIAAAAAAIIILVSSIHLNFNIVY